MRLSCSNLVTVKLNVLLSSCASDSGSVKFDSELDVVGASRITMTFPRDEIPADENPSITQFHMPNKIKHISGVFIDTASS